MTWFRSIFVLTLLCNLLSVANGETYTPGQKVSKDFETFAKSFLATHCIDCHGKTEPEGNLSLEDLGPVDEVNAAT